MERHELFIAVGDAAEAYDRDMSLDDLEMAINEDYAPSLIHKEFDNEDQSLGFCEALEFCGDGLGCERFWVIDPETEEERERLMRLSE